MSVIDRRTVLKGAAAAGVAAIAGPFTGLLAEPVLAKPSPRDLRPIKDKRDGKVRLWMPAGFNYRSFHDTESPVTLDDGTLLPGRHDGMAAFGDVRRHITLVRNHEVNGPVGAFGDPSKAYDPATGGGTTTTVVSRHGEVLQSYTSLNGTQMNCSGGPTPWGSWITCEETVNGPDVGADFTGASNVTLTKPHGYLFEVPADGESTRTPITQAGRFAHEAIAVDPQTGTVYMTEDNFGFPSGFYRFVPAVNPMETGFLADAGQLQMLAVVAMPNADLAVTQPRNVTYDIEWVDIDEPDFHLPYTPGQPAPTPNDTAINIVGAQGRAKGAAYFSRLEGAYQSDGIVYFTSTQGGGPAEPALSDPVQGWGNGTGQVWAYDIAGQQLHLLYQSPGANVLDFPDNVTVSRNGTVVLCEDNVNDNYVRGLTPQGRLIDIALNRLVSSTGADRSNDEFAGATFSPDGHTLFVNIQASRGMTFAIWGPWASIGV
jgi:secreted PhoX family phosphatase